MKKITSLLLICLAAVFMLSGCNVGKTNEPERLSAEEILALPQSYSIADKLLFPKNFSEAWDYYSPPYFSGSVIKGKALSVKYYLGFDREECCTLVKFQIEDVIDEYNNADLKQGDTITLYSDSHIIFQDSDNGIYEFFSKNMGMDIKNAEELRAARKAQAASGMFEFVPKKGGSYIYNLAYEDYPMQEGDSYTMLVLYRNPEKHRYYKEESYCTLYIMPLNEEMSYEKINEKYGWNLKPYGEIYKEIAALFE